MPAHGPPFDVFYCASNADETFVAKMQKSLAVLTNSGFVRGWSYETTVPGQSISDTAKERMAQSDILACLLSPDFLGSPECMEQWEYAGKLVASNPRVFRVPIIVRKCPWQDLFADDDPMTLPRDGRPISSFTDEDAAWLQVYEGIKQIVDTLTSRIMPRETFVNSINELEIPSLRSVDLEMLYVFPNLNDQKIPEQSERLNSYPIRSAPGLLTVKRAIIHGPDQSGKTALARFLYLHLVRNHEPALLIASPSNRRLDASFFKTLYESQFNGDYTLWEKQTGKTLIIDGIHPGQQGAELLKAADGIFESILLIIPSDMYYSMYFDDIGVSKFRVLTIEPLTSNQQEQLIRRTLALKTGGQTVADGEVDQIEQRVNHIIVSNKIVPRYPFFVLSILESFDTFTPGSMPITSFGHCYYALIVSRLVHAGIGSDDAMNTCFNFLEEIAYATYVRKNCGSEDQGDLENFVARYRKHFIIQDAILNRLSHPEFGVIDNSGNFRSDYIYYFMLGKYLANGRNNDDDTIAALCDDIHLETNFLTILFTIHHTNDNRLVDDILLRTMFAFDHVEPAELTKTETNAFGTILGALPESILPDEPVEDVRALTRDTHDKLRELGADSVGTVPDDVAFTPIVNMLRIYRNSKIMGQVLRTKHGNINIKKLEEIIETIAEAGLRLIRISLMDEQQINRMKEAVRSQIKDLEPDIQEIDEEQLTLNIEYLTLIGVLLNIQQIVSCVNVPEIEPIVNQIVNRKNNAAFDLIGYCAMLESSAKLTWRARHDLARLLDKHDDIFVKRILSFVTQGYMGAHTSDAPVEQSICALLGIKYVARPNARG